MSKGGNDSANGQTEETPVKTLEKALETAKALKASLNAEINILVMNPIEIMTDKSYDGEGTQLVPWENRENKTQDLINIKKGTLTLKDIVLAQGNVEKRETTMMIKEGTLKLEEQVEIQGNLYFSVEENQEIFPKINILKPLEEEKIYHLDIDNINAFLGKALIQGLYPEDIKGEFLLKHFILSEKFKESFELMVSKDEDGEKSIFVNPKSVALMAQPRIGKGIVYWNVNPEDIPATADRPKIPKGIDTNTGITEEFPVLTLEKAKELIGDAGGRIIVMTPVTVGTDLRDSKDTDNYVLDGEGKVSFEQWSASPVEIFTIPEGITLTLRKTSISGVPGNVSSLIRITDPGPDSGKSLGTLKIGANIIITNGNVQTELNPDFIERLTAPTVEVLPEVAVPAEGASEIGVYYSGIKDNLVFKHQDVIKTPVNTQATTYLPMFDLGVINKSDGWYLQQDLENLDTDGKNDNHLELAKDFVYTGIYANGVNGNDQWFGGNCNWPVKSFEGAKKVLIDNWDKIEASNRDIYICDTMEITETETWNLTNDKGIDLSPLKILPCRGTEEHKRFHNNADVPGGKPTSPQTLIKVKDGGNLTTEAMNITYDLPNPDNIMVDVEAGGTYNLAGTVLSNGNLDPENKVLNRKCYGTGVRVTGGLLKDTVFNMSGGKVTQKETGVKVTQGAVFNLEGGKVSYNYRTLPAGGSAQGVGVNIDNSIFNLKGGEVSYNSGTNGEGTGCYYGFGVHVTGKSSVFTMSAGSINANGDSGKTLTIPGYGGGVYVDQGKFVLEDQGEIKGNKHLASGNKEGGSGIYVNTDASMEMRGGKISSNKNNFYGGGIYTKGSLSISGGRINQNVVENPPTNSSTRGAGIYVAETAALSMTGGTIEFNQSLRSQGGGGIYIEKGTPKVMIANAQIISNQTVNTARSNMAKGGGIYNLRNGVKIISTTIKSCTSSDGGGGIYNKGPELSITDSTITENKITEFKGTSRTHTEGAGLYIDAKTRITGGVISRNKMDASRTESMGGGLYILDNTIIEGTSIIENEAATGGGIYLALGIIEIRNGKINENSATKGNGRGIFQEMGGLSIAGEETEILKNAATGQGSSLYLESFSGTTTLLHGTYDAQNANSDRYGIFFNKAISVTNSLDINQTDIKDKVFFNTAPSRLTLVAQKEAESTKTLPIYVNTKEFTAGSIIAEPMKEAGKFIIGSETYSYAALSDAAPSASYFTEGSLPPKTMIGGVAPNVVLIGEGIYLDGKNGDDNRAGLSPDTAVKTFKKAKARLEEAIAEAKAEVTDTDGFDPFIFVCGEVATNGTGEETHWHLDYENEAFKQDDNNEKAQIKRFGSYTGIMVKVNSAVTIGKLIMDGNAGGMASDKIGAILSVVNGGNLSLDQATIQNNKGTGIDMENGTAKLTGIPTLKTTIQEHTGYGISVKKGSRLTMGEDSVVKTSNVLNSNLGFSALQVEDQASKITMESNAMVEGTGRHGVIVGERDTESSEPIFEMKGNASIVGGAVSRSGIRVMGGKNALINISEQALIDGWSSGISVESFGTPTDNCIINLVDEAKIRGVKGNSNGLRVNNTTMKKMTFNLKDKAEIQGDDSGAGVRVEGMPTNAPSETFVLNMVGTSKISNLQYGIVIGRPEVLCSGIAINISEKGQIGNNTHYGIITGTYEKASVYKHNPVMITLKDEAILGGASKESGNGYGGVFAGVPIKLVMKDQSKIKNNGKNTDGVKVSGIYLDGSSKGVKKDGSEILLTGKAEISDNRGNGIFSVDPPEKEERILTNKITIKENAKVINNTKKGILVNRDGILNLEGTPEISGNNIEAPDEIGSAIEAEGKVNLSGGAKIEGDIYLKRYENIVTLTEPITDPNKHFFLSCTENFIGQKLVSPDGTTVTDATVYLGNFKKGVLFPPNRELQSLEKDIIVSGENNVFLAGRGTTPGVASGDDHNNGNGPGVPVATFLRAKELLSKLSPGANIVICNYSVEIKGDETWEFGPGGAITNEKGEIWIPKVLRYESVTTEMIKLNNSGDKLSLKNITIDGNSEKMKDMTGAIIKNTASGTLTLGEGSILENNAVADVNGGGIYNEGTLNINGGNVRNNVLLVKTAMGKGYGAGIYNHGSGAKLTFNSGSIEDNINTTEVNGYSYGGGIGNIDGTVTIKGGRIGNNKSQSDKAIQTYGGGLYTKGGRVDILGGLIEGNEVKGNTSRGSAIYQESGILEVSGEPQIIQNKVESSGKNPTAEGTIFTKETANIKGAVISGNEVINQGNNGTAKGGGIYQLNGNLKLTAVTIENNQCLTPNRGKLVNVQNGDTQGGGIYQYDGDLEFISGTIRENTATRGAAAYFWGNKAEITSGKIEKNISNSLGIRGGANSEVFVETSGFKLKGGGCEITDFIYLESTHPIGISGSIYQTNRLYNIELSRNFKKGTVVVKPDADVIQSAVGYIRYFNVPQVGLVLEKQGDNLALKQGVYINGETGDDTKNGENPDNAVKTFERAKAVGGTGDYIIYASGPILVDGEKTWELPTTSSICRYTGFKVNGTTPFTSYTGSIIKLDTFDDRLTLSNMQIAGRRDFDPSNPGGALIELTRQSTVTMKNGVGLSLNTASDKGAGILNNDGTLEIQGGSIERMNAPIGSAIYQNGVMSIDNKPNIDGEVYLTGTGVADDTSKHIKAAKGYSPGPDKKLSVNIENPFDKRKVIEYPELGSGEAPDLTLMNQYTIPSAIAAMYNLGNRSNENTLELQEKAAVYLDGVNGDDNRDGKTPRTSVKTIGTAYEKIKTGGGVILVVDTVTVREDIKLTARSYTKGSETVTTTGPVFFRRYAQPTAWEELPGYDVSSHQKTLVNVSAGKVLEVDNLSFEGHSQQVVGDKEFAALGIEAHSALISVNGELKVNKGKIHQNKNTAEQGKSAGIFIDAGGKLTSIDISISEVEVSSTGQGSAIYHQGEKCSLDRAPNIEGEIHLTGKNSPESSRFIRYEQDGYLPVKKLMITMDDPYKGRKIGEFNSSQNPSIATVRSFNFKKSVTDLFSLGKREAFSHILELQDRQRVYIDGVKGLDAQTGESPDTSVKTLKEAYTKLAALGGGILYVVDTVIIEDETILTDHSLTENGEEIRIVGGNVDIRRYVKPTEIPLTGFTKASNINRLFSVSPGTAMSIKTLDINGHSDEIVGKNKYEDAPSVISKAPLIEVDKGNLVLGQGAKLHHNNNSLNEADSIFGGAIKNSGEVIFDGAVLENNMAKKGSGIYQDGIFTIVSQTTGLKDQEIYLTDINIGSVDHPVWSTAHVIYQQEYVNNTVKININVDNPSRGRDVIVYAENVIPPEDPLDGMYDRYTLGSSITGQKPTLFLVGSEEITEPNTLELQNYEVLDVSVPTEVFLVMAKIPATYQLKNAQMTSPDYTVTNHGSKKVKISIKGFETSKVGLHDQMSLVNDRVSLAKDNEIYMAIKGTNAEDTNGFKALSETTLTTKPIEMGTLSPNNTGKFTFIGEALPDFFTKYKDIGFDPTIPDVEAYIKGNPRAQHKMTYKLEGIR